MFKFYKNNVDEYDEVFDTNRKIIKNLLKDKVISLSDLDKHSSPYSLDQIIPRLDSIVGDSKLSINSISKTLNLKSFSSIDEKDITIESFFGTDFVVVDRTYYSSNPLSYYIKNLKELLKKESNILFDDIGYISSYELKRIHKNLENNTSSKNKELNISNLKIEYIIKDIIINALKKDASSFGLRFKNGKIHKLEKIDYNQREEIILRCSVEEYNSFSNYIKSLFRKDFIIIDYKGDRIKLKLKINKSTEDGLILDVISVKISNLDKNNFSYSDLEMNTFDKKELDKKIESPFGLMILSSRLNIKKSLYEMIEIQKKTKILSKIYTVENNIELNIKEVIQFEKPIEMKISEIDFENNNVVAIEEASTKEDFDFINNLVSSGKFVILGINANSSIEAFSKLKSLTSNLEMLSDNLLGVLHIDNIPKVCPHCSTDIEFIKSSKYLDFSFFDNSPKMNSLIKVENNNGCYKCINGYKGMIKASEFLNNDQALKDTILNKSNLSTLRIEKTSSSWENIFEYSSKLLTKKITTQNAIINTLGRTKKG